MRSNARSIVLLCCCAAVALGILPETGCGGTSLGSGPKSTSQSVVIVTQPSSQSVPLGQGAEFTVVASGTAPLSYQWSENGEVIEGATGTSYAIPAVTAADSGSTFTAIVSNGGSSATSNTATLTVGPRSPEAGDLRFKGVDASFEAEQGTALSASSEIELEESGFAAQESFADNAVGSPLTIGAVGGCYEDPAPFATCIWSFFGAPLPAGQSGVNEFVLVGLYANFDPDLTSSLISGQEPPDMPNNVITSLDFQPAFNAYALAWLQTQQGSDFDFKREIVSPGTVQSTVAADAAASRVVTAVSFDANGQVNLVSYNWQGDTTTVYDSTVVSAASEQDIESDAQMLAGQGYILTAFGGDPSDGFLLIGTKVQGDTIPRPLLIFDQSTSACSGCATGIAPVAWYRAPSGPDFAVVYEK
jgi:Immunoglobulin domain